MIFTSLIGEQSKTSLEDSRTTRASRFVTGGLKCPDVIVVAIVPELATDTFAQNLDNFAQLKTVSTTGSYLALSHVLESSQSWSHFARAASGAHIIELESANDFDAAFLKPSVTNVVVVTLPSGKSGKARRAVDAAVTALVHAVEEAAEGDVVGIFAAEASATLPYTMEYPSLSSRSIDASLRDAAVLASSNMTNNNSTVIKVALNWTPGIWQGLLVVLVVFIIMLIASCCLLNIKSQASYELPGQTQKILT